MSTPRYRGAPPSLSGSAISVSKAITPSSPGLKSDIGVCPLFPGGSFPAGTAGTVRRALGQACRPMRTIRPGAAQATAVSGLVRGSVPMDTSQRAPGLETLSEDTFAGDPVTQFPRSLGPPQRRGLPDSPAMLLR